MSVVLRDHEDNLALTGREGLPPQGADAFTVGAGGDPGQVADGALAELVGEVEVTRRRAWSSP